MAGALEAALLEEAIATRRDLHAHPELGFEEQRTAALVAERLRALGYQVHERIGQTGVVGVLRAPAVGRTVMLRADMDALPVDEESGAAYASREPGKMHACGHDGHVAILLAAARAIAARRAELAGTLVLCFQPAEEGRGGARAMLADGLLERFGIERAYGLHLFSQLSTGTIGLRPGPFYASSDSIEIAIEGKGGHGAAPHLSLDPILVGAEFVCALQKIVSREVDPVEPAVVTIGAFHSGTIHNVIPPRASLLGTVRAFDEAVRDAMPERIERILRAACASSGARYTFEYLRRYPVTVNDPEQARYVRALAERTFGSESVVESPRHMGAEDFAFYAERVPACFVVVGSGSSEATRFPHHHPHFDFDEAALATGIRLMLALALDAPREAP
ncbi:MAG: M20 metallopeptidase family protein [Vulcanimicrobiaceae bacterium]